MDGDGVLTNGTVNAGYTNNTLKRSQHDVDAADTEEDRERWLQRDILRQRWKKNDGVIDALFSGRRVVRDCQDHKTMRPSPKRSHDNDAAEDVIPAIAAPAPKRIKPARIIDDDYGDDEDEEDKDDSSTAPQVIAPTLHSPSLMPKPPLSRAATTAPSELSKTSEDAAKKLQEEREAAEAAARRSFYTQFYTLEYDREAMLEQQKLEQLDKQIEDETQASGERGQGVSVTSGPTQGTLSSADLGASSLTLKNLIARIEAKRQDVHASDEKLRVLFSEVRKGRSKWASEEKVNQEELYEAAEKVLMELKAMTQYSAPFMQRVPKREVPDYYLVIKQPMDIGTMLKKLKTFSYKSKAEFVNDLDLIWLNCLKYNQDPGHPLRKKAIYMQKETAKLVPMIPDLVVKDRAEVEKEERLHNAYADLDGVEDSDDDRPIMASRGRKAPSKGKKGTNGVARKTPVRPSNEVAGADNKQQMSQQHAPISNPRTDFLRAESDVPQDSMSNGFSTPPPGLVTPSGILGVPGSGAPGSQVDITEVDNLGNSIVGTHAEEDDDEDPEFKTWKQVTSKDRANFAKERSRLFNGYKLNPEETAPLRTRAGMRKWMRQQQLYKTDVRNRELDAAAEQTGTDPPAPTETLTEGLEKDEDSTLPDYYDVMNAIPDLDEYPKWIEDSEGNVTSQNENYLKIFPKESFTSCDSNLSKKMESNMRQIQDTRKVCAKIGVVKQMQIQTQTYQNQFQKYEPEPFVEQDIGSVAVSEDGPIMAPWLCRAAFQRSVAKVFYHAGFEDFQPSALDAATDIASDFFRKITRTLGAYRESPKAKEAKEGFSQEQQVLHALHESGMDLEGLENYVKDDVGKLSSKLDVVHQRMKAHLADLLRPALGEHAGADGAGAFNDGSEQFVGGDFAEDIGDDFFGFKELGLAAEYGLESLSVPLHLLQGRMHSAYQSQHTSESSASATGVVLEPPPAYSPITVESLPSKIGLVQDLFGAKLHANGDAPLVEDEDLPQKQRFPKPRLPPTGKISSPRKKPIREQQAINKKKRKLEEEGSSNANNNASGAKPLGKLEKKLRLEMPQQKGNIPEPEKDDAGGMNGAMISPESLTAG
ncbi:Transcriptional activator spt7 [Elasticomyces elasticus]|nr:Transcriptional activator spt7 [Elasticomyces elasticus]